MISNLQSNTSIYEPSSSWNTYEGINYAEKQKHEKKMLASIKAPEGIDTSIKSNFKKNLEYFLQYSENNINKFFVFDTPLTCIGDDSVATLLHIAVNLANNEAIELLLEKGANTDIQLSNGSTPLHIASESNNIEAIELLLRYNASTTIFNNNDLPIHAACSNQHIQVVTILLEHNYKLVNYFNKSGISLLHIAIQKSDRAMINLLLSNGANINLSSLQSDDNLKIEKGTTPLILACSQDNIDLALLMLSYNAKYDKKTASGFQAIHYAAKNGSLVLIEELVTKGANVNAKSKIFKGSCTPLMLAIIYKKNDVAEYLIEQGANLYDKGIEKTIGWSKEGRYYGLFCYLLCFLCIIPCEIQTICSEDRSDPNISTFKARQAVFPCMRPTTLSLLDDGDFKNLLIRNSQEVAQRKTQQRNNKNMHTNIAINNTNKKLVTKQPMNIVKDYNIDRGECSSHQEEDKQPPTYKSLFPSKV